MKNKESQIMAVGITPANAERRIHWDRGHLARIIASKFTGAGGTPAVPVGRLRWDDTLFLNGGMGA
jgi:hypothetical protein